MKLDLRDAGPAHANGIVGVLTLTLVAFAAPEACGSAVSRGRA
jgi:hypothetical protein